MKPSADELICVGFFYEGYGDSVECFFVVLHFMIGKQRTML